MEGGYQSKEFRSKIQLLEQSSERARCNLQGCERVFLVQHACSVSTYCGECTTATRTTALSSRPCSDPGEPAAQSRTSRVTQSPSGLLDLPLQVSALVRRLARMECVTDLGPNMSSGRKIARPRLRRSNAGRIAAPQLDGGRSSLLYSSSAERFVSEGWDILVVRTLPCLKTIYARFEAERRPHPALDVQ